MRDMSQKPVEADVTRIKFDMRAGNERSNNSTPMSSY